MFNRRQARKHNNKNEFFVLMETPLAMDKTQEGNQKILLSGL